MSLDVFLRHRFGAFALEVEFRIARPCVTALFGPSGAGKTSVVNAIAGLFRPREGRIVLGGRTLLDTGARLCIPPEERRAGYVFQDSRLFPHMSVEDNLRFGWRRAATRAGPAEIAHVIELLGLGHLLKRPPRALSGGEKARVALGRALLSSPEVLLLDEPLAALDAARRGEILPYLERLRDETRLPMVYVSHLVEEVARIADEVVMLRDGRVAAQGPVFDLLTRIEAGEGAAAGAVIDTAVAAHRAAEGLSELGFDGGRLVVPLLARAPGERVRVRVRAEDILLACEEPRAISANNVLAATVSAVRAGAGPHADIQLACGGIRLVARITRASAERLSLRPGMPVYAVIKSVIVDSSN
ncbi:MAG TPA: molybdenum ABC transporter ATP-binding protein [Rhizomicrobium sp.]|jgi:molybdate transport system ATP-binding protein|nr:molybdenum ABC transporter ATP-binding protein [Rhizomicrobium sp.]